MHFNLGLYCSLRHTASCLFTSSSVRYTKTNNTTVGKAQVEMKDKKTIHFWTEGETHLVYEIVGKFLDMCKYRNTTLFNNLVVKDGPNGQTSPPQVIIYNNITKL